MFDAAKEIKRLVKLTGDKGVDESSLDELVHDLISGIASDVNNGGVEKQIEFIVAQLGPNAEKAIRQTCSEFDQWVTNCPKCGKGTLVVRDAVMSNGERVTLNVPLHSDGFEIPEGVYEGKDCSTEDEKVVCTSCHEEYDLYQLDRETLASNEITGAV